MPRITNIETGKGYTVTDEELKAIQDNPATKKLYTYPKEAKAPEEVENLNAAGEKPKAPKADAKAEAGK